MTNTRSRPLPRPTTAVRAGEGPILVRLTDRAVPLTAVRNSPTRFVRLLARAKSEVGHAECLCQPGGHKLVVRVRAGRYHLAGWPDDGHRHAPHCAFHKAAPSLTGRSHYTDQAIREDETGTAIRLKQPLTTRTMALGRHAGDVPHEDCPAARGTVGLLGLLHYLWEQAQLNQWHPSWHRSWSTCCSRLRCSVDDCTVSGQELSEVLYVVPPYRPARAETNARDFADFRGRLHGRRGVEHRGLLLGELKDTTPTRHGVRVRLRHLPNPLFATTALVERTRRSYRPAFSTAAIDGLCRRIVLLLVRRSIKGHLLVDDLAAMLSTSSYVPADSSHEIRMAHALTAAGRSFVKPLRYDTTDGVFPDFVLTDEPSGPVYVEVYGMNGLDSYRERKHAKQAHYRAHDIPVIEWSVTEPLPTLVRRPR